MWEEGLGGGGFIVEALYLGLEDFQTEAESAHIVCIEPSRSLILFLLPQAK